MDKEIPKLFCGRILFMVLSTVPHEKPSAGGTLKHRLLL
jgi:hypothetical protein